MNLKNKLIILLTHLFILSYSIQAAHLTAPLFPVKFINGMTIIPQNISLKPSTDIKFKDLPYEKDILKAALKDSVIGDSNVISTQKPPMQTMTFNIIGVHKRECIYALRKISRYEEFEKYISFIKKSSYKNGRINLLLSSALLPVKMRLNFRLPRIDKVGKYPFIFDNGFLMGLTGFINVTEHKNRCVFYSTAFWNGTDTGFSNLVMEIFSGMLSDIALRTLFKISK